MARIRTILRLLTLALVTLTLGGLFYVLTKSSEASQNESRTSEPKTAELAVVEYVIDGDTVDVIIDGSEERVRLIGIDTPETVNRQTPIQCYGAEASEALRELIPEGTGLRIERDAEARDRYGRLLLYLYRAEDGLFINAWMVEQGYAAATSYRPNVAFEVTFAEAESAAKQSQLGLWGSCDGPDQPLD